MASASWSGERIVSAGAATFVDTPDRVGGVTDGDLPGACRAALHLPLDQVHQQDLQQALDLLDLVVTAHFFRLPDQD